MSHVIYQYQENHFCIWQSGLAWKQQKLSPNVSLQPHSAQGARGFCRLIWYPGVALITVEFAKGYLRGGLARAPELPSSAWAF